MNILQSRQIMTLYVDMGKNKFIIQFITNSKTFHFYSNVRLFLTNNHHHHRFIFQQLML